MTTAPRRAWSYRSALLVGFVIGAVAAAKAWVEAPMPQPLIGLTPGEFTTGKIISAASTIVMAMLVALLVRWVRNRMVGAR